MCILERACLITAEIDPAPCRDVTYVDAGKTRAVLESTDTGSRYAGTDSDCAHTVASDESSLADNAVGNTYAPERRIICESGKSDPLDRARDRDRCQGITSPECTCTDGGDTFVDNYGIDIFEMSQLQF